MLFAMLHLCAEVLGCTAGWFNASLPEWLRGWTPDPMHVTARGVRNPQLAQLLLPSSGLSFPSGWRGMPGPALLQLSGGESSLQIGGPLYTLARGLLCGPLCCSQVFFCVACVVARSV